MSRASTASWPLPPTAQFYMYGRNALYAALSQLAEAGVRSVGFPAYSCGDEVAVADALGLDLHFYHITPELQIDKVSFDATLAHVDAVVITVFFGLTDLRTEYFASRARDAGKSVIIDCAYSFWGDTQGQWGDYAIYSLRKHLPIAHGGALVARPGVHMPPPPKVPSATAIDRELATYAGYQNGTFKLGSGTHQSIGSNVHGPRLADEGGYQLAPAPMVLQDIARLAKNEPEEHYGSILEALESRLPSRMLDLAVRLRGTQASYLPIRVDGATALQQQLNERNVYAAVAFWNRAHPYLDWGEYPPEAQLKDSILALSIRRPISTTDLEKIMETIQ